MSPAKTTKRRRILILDENLSVPFDRRVWKESTALVEAGYHVAVICPKGDAFDTQTHETINGVSIYRFGVPEARAGLAAYLLEYSLALIRMFGLSLVVFFRQGFDVIQLCNPPDLLFLVALPYKLLGKKVIFDHHDLSPETYLSKMSRPNANIIHKILLILERLTFRFADMVISTNESYKAVAMSRGGVDAERIAVIRNGPDLQRFQRPDPNVALRRGKQSLIFYVGSMGSQDGVDYLLRAVQLLKCVRDDFCVLIVGGGPELEPLRRYANELSVDDVVTFTGRLPDHQMMQALWTADVCVCPDPKNALNDVSTMLKTMEYMAASKPIVAFDLVETRVSAGDAALYARPNDEHDYAEKVSRLLDSPILRKEMGEIGRRRVIEALAWDHSKINLVQAYECVMQQPKVPGNISKAIQPDGLNHQHDI